MSETEFSVVIPVYKTGGHIEELISRLHEALGALGTAYEIIFVDDGSPDDSWGKILLAARNSSAVKGLKLTRNFGQHFAITAGLRFSSGNWVVVMDGDLQDRPEEIPLLLAEARKGYDIVFARRASRNEHWFKVFEGRLFYWLLNLMLRKKLDSRIGSFGIYGRNVVDEFNKLTEHSRAFYALISTLGFRTSYVDVNRTERIGGGSAYSLSRRFGLATDIVTSQSNRPLYITIFVGVLNACFGFLLALVFTYRYFAYGLAVPGWTSVIVSLYFLFGLMFCVLGVLGLYIGKIFDESRRRPLFTIQERMGEFEPRPPPPQAS